MNTIKLKIHSVVDLITNSSTTIFTYSEGSLPALKELVNEMLKTFGRSESFDDIFYAGIFLDDYSVYFEADSNLTADSEDYLSTFGELGWDERSNLFDIIKLQVLKGEIERPEWMETAEGYNRWDDYAPETTLEIMPKSDEYQELANLLIRFLYSTDHEATYC